MSARRRQARSAYTEQGCIRVIGMRFWGRHGAGRAERLRQQPIDVDVSMQFDVARAARSDALKNTVDYAAVFQTCERIVMGKSFRLLEALANAISDALWSQQALLSLTVRVRKPRLLDGATPEIEITRQSRLP